MLRIENGRAPCPGLRFGAGGLGRRFVSGSEDTWFPFFGVVAQKSPALAGLKSKNFQQDEKS